MIGIETLLEAVDAYKAASGLERDSTLSSRMFNDGKRLGLLRAGHADITVGRFNAALAWLRDNWPEGHPLPSSLCPRREDAA
jgi:hypothetical protein